MHTLQRIFDWKTYIFTVLAVISFSSFMVVLFGHTIPGIIIAFFKVAGEYVILGTVLIFAFSFLDASLVLTFQDSEFFEFRGTEEPECALLLKRDRGILFTCDAIQHYGDYSYNNWLAKILMPRIGFPKTTIIGPYWLKLMTPEGSSLESEFKRLLELDFDKLLSGHGTFIAEGARGAVKKALENAFPVIEPQ